MYQDDFKVNAKVLEVALGEASTGNVQLGIRFETDDDQVRQITHYLFFTDDTLKNTEKALTALGWAPAANNWNVDDMLEQGVLIGKTCSLVIGKDVYNGRERWKVKFINSSDGALMKKVYGVDERKGFAQRLREKVRASGGHAPEPRKRPATQSQPVARADDDGIPF